MSNRGISGNRKAMTATSLITMFGYVMGVTLVLLILWLGGGFFGLIRTAEAATTVDGGFFRMVQKIDLLKSEPQSTQIKEGITVDKNLFLVGFNSGLTRSGKALKPPECGGAACLCICVNDDCTKIDVNNNRGRDCRKLPEYNAIVAQKGVSSNEVKQATPYVGSPDGYYFYIKGAETLVLTLQIKTVGPDTNLYIGKSGP